MNINNVYPFHGKGGEHRVLAPIIYSPDICDSNDKVIVELNCEVQRALKRSEHNDNQAEAEKMALAQTEVGMTPHDVTARMLRRQQIGSGGHGDI